MKIEIGESLAYSWLKHIKCCQIVQLNWKLADKWQKGNWEKLDSMFKEAKLYFTTSDETKSSLDAEEESHVFKKNATLEQIVRQAESDVLGIHFNTDGEIEVHAVEVAFHSQGLNYTGGKESTKAKIIAKVLRSAMGIYTVFGAKKAHIYFLSPKVNPATIETLKYVEEELNMFFKEFELDYQFSAYFNELFSREILLPVYKIVAEQGANDTSELCARAICLQQIAEGNRDKTTQINNTTVNTPLKAQYTSINTKTAVNTNRRAEFERWLFEEDGKSRYVAYGYANALKSKKMLELCRKIDSVSFYEMSSPNQANHLYQLLKHNHEFSYHNATHSGTPNAAIQRYIEFLKKS